MTEYQSAYDSTFMFMKDFREPSLSFELMYFRNSFCFRIENIWSFRHKILCCVGLLGTNFIFKISLGIAWDFVGFLFILKLSYSKPFYSTLDYASTANIEEVTKFYNVGNKSFETDFSQLRSI